VTIFLGADHGGFELKSQLADYLTAAGLTVVDMGADQLDPQDDFPQYAYAVATKVLGEDTARGILICGSGQGMAMAANRVRGIRASVVWSVEVAHETRQDNDSNVLCLPARFIGWPEAQSIVDSWLSTPFSKDPKYHRRIDEVEQIYG
jgi:ribose 5-phosphate isomerase B